MTPTPTAPSPAPISVPSSLAVAAAPVVPDVDDPVPDDPAEHPGDDDRHEREQVRGAGRQARGQVTPAGAVVAGHARIVRRVAPVGCSAMREWLVASALVEVDGALLLVRNERRGGFSDWSTPGGVIDAEDQSVLTGLTREVEEETGLRVTDWEGPVYEVRAVAQDMGWRLRAEVLPGARLRGRAARRRPGRDRGRGRVRRAPGVRRPARRRRTVGAGAAQRVDRRAVGARRGPRLRLRRTRHSAATTWTCTAPRSPPADRARRARDPPRRPRRLLRLGRAARRPGAARPAGHRRRPRPPGCRRGRELRGAPLRRPLARCRWPAPGGPARTACSSRRASTRTPRRAPP